MFLKMWSFTTLFGLLISVKIVFTANILYISLVPSPSHHIWNRALAYGLVNKGHNVTLIGADEDNLKRPSNYTFIWIEDVYLQLEDEFEYNDMLNLGPYAMLKEFLHWGDFVCSKTLNTKGLQRLLDYSENYKFDAIIYDITTGYCHYPLIHRFNYPPTGGVSPFLLPPYVSYEFGNTLQTAYMPWYALPFSDHMNFMERVYNFIFTRLDIFLRYRNEFRKQEKMAKERYGANTPPLEEVVKNINIALVNTDPLLDYPQPMPPNIISVGGLHTRKPKETPAEYKTILDEAKNGVIIFSLGTNIRSDKLNPSQKKAIFGALGRLKETVIWKFESDNLEGVPKNVIIKKWLPQNDVLSHPNVKLFIGHGGSLSTQETIYHGVPMIVIPFVVDQFINAKRIAEKNLGMFVHPHSITEDLLYNRIREVIDNPIYRQNMKRTSERFNDRTETPLERAIFWVEYSLRHQGAGFLNPRSKDLTWYKVAEIDIIAFFMGVVIFAILIVLKLLKLLYRLVLPSPSKILKQKIN